MVSWGTVGAPHSFQILRISMWDVTVTRQRKRKERKELGKRSKNVLLDPPEKESPCNIIETENIILYVDVSRRYLHIPGPTI